MDKTLSRILDEDLSFDYIKDDKEDHGPAHWFRVSEIGRYLAEGTEADIKVIDLFAFLHDLKRENDGHDPDHGLKASKMVENIHKAGIFNLSKTQAEQLAYACKFHSNTDAKSDDLTVRICWDADRLDLVRFNIAPDKKLLFTEKAKTLEATLFAMRLSNQEITEERYQKVFPHSHQRQLRLWKLKRRV